jgi:glutaconate CoA-transferase subunit B
MSVDRIRPEERMIAAIAARIGDAGHVAVGAASPVPAAAAFLQRRRNGRTRVSLLHKRRGNPFTDGARELFDLAGQGRIDVFFLGGGQIDGQANINLVGIGDYPGTTARFPGSFGSAFMYFTVPRVILFREEHSPRVLVDKVDFISAPGVSPANVVRPGGPDSLVTGMALFGFDRDRGRFRLESVHPGHSVADVAANTGFAYDAADPVAVTPAPDAETLALLRGPVAGDLADSYPDFAARVFGAAA